MNGAGRRLAGALAVIVMGCLLLAGMALVPDGGVSARQLAPQTWSVTDQGDRR